MGLGLSGFGVFTPGSGNAKGLSHVSSLDLARMLAELGSLLLVARRCDELGQGRRESSLCF